MKEVLTPIKRFFNMLKVDKQEIFSIYLYALFNGIIALSIPLGIQAIISFITAGQISSSWILLVVMVVLGIALSGVMQIMQLSITENLQQKIFTRSAFEFAYRIPRIKSEALEGSYMPELVNRFFDTLSIQKGLPKILMDFSSAALQIIFGLILLSLYHPFFIMFSLFLILIVYLIFKYTTPKGLRTSIQESTHKYEVAHWLEEIARSNSTFKLAGRTTLPLEKTDEKVRKYLGSRKAHFKTLLLQFINLVGFKMLIAAGLLIIGGLLVINQQMNIGQFVAAEIIIILVLSSVEKLILSIETIYDMLTAIEKVGSITDLELEKDKGVPINFVENKGVAIGLRDLTYTFPNSNKPVLKNINIELGAGKNLCISGRNGSGKSFMLQLIAGLYESYDGAITFNDIPISSLCKEELRVHIGDNLNKEDIFKGTLYENIALGKTYVQPEEVRDVCNMLGLNTYISSLKYGLETELLPEGKSLPRSIRVKIMLARAIVGNPKLILLEDNFNDLNVSDRNRVVEYLIAKGDASSVIAVSNDPEIAQLFDNVLVLDQGETLAIGEYNSLKGNSWFNEIFQIK